MMTSLLLVIIAGFINSVFLIQKAKENELEKLDTINAVIWIVAGVLTLIQAIVPTIPSFTFYSLSLNLILIIIVPIVLTAVFLSVVVLRRKLLISRTFSHLTIHCTKDDEDQKYVEFRLTKQAYPLIPVLENCSKREKFNKKIHKNETQIKKFFLKYDIHLNKKLDDLKDLGLVERRDGSVNTREVELDPVSSAKLQALKNERKLEKYHIWFIFPRPYFLLYFLFSYWENRHFPTRKRIIVDHNTHKAYPAPPESLALIDNKFLDHRNITPWKLWATISRICNENNPKIEYLKDESFPISRLIAEAENLTSPT